MAQKERWNEVKTKAFINSYLHKPALWDSHNSGYSQKSEKIKAYEVLMEEFGLTLNEVRNKIRIYRTTYMQEKNKEATIANYVPRLSWYNDMKLSFKEGQVKSFAKTPTVSNKKRELALSIKKEKDHSNSQPSSPNQVQFEYIENDGETDENNSMKAENSLPTHIIIEPYDEEEEEIQSNLRDSGSFSKSSQHSDSKSKSTNLPSSNELFLQSLKSTLDKLSDEKNMRARIKIQEILYSIMYEKS